MGNRDPAEAQDHANAGAAAPERVAALDASGDSCRETATLKERANVACIACEARAINRSVTREAA